jgi:putative hydrolase of HD superfamily
MLKDAFEFYYKATELKDLLRSGDVQWSVNKDRLESIAEHTYGCMILAIALHSELELDVELSKVLEMIAIHELEELSIGDITPLDKIDKNSLKERAESPFAN